MPEKLTRVEAQVGQKNLQVRGQAMAEILYFLLILKLIHLISSSSRDKQIYILFDS